VWKVSIRKKGGKENPWGGEITKGGVLGAQHSKEDMGGGIRKKRHERKGRKKTLRQGGTRDSTGSLREFELQEGAGESTTQVSAEMPKRMNEERLCWHRAWRKRAKTQRAIWGRGMTGVFLWPHRKWFEKKVHCSIQQGEVKCEEEFGKRGEQKIREAGTLVCAKGKISEICSGKGGRIENSARKRKVCVYLCKRNSIENRQ